MIRKAFRYGACCLLLSLNLQTVHADTNPQVLLESLESYFNLFGDKGSAAKIRNLSSDESQVIYEAFGAQGQTFVDAVQTMQDQAAAAEEQRLLVLRQHNVSPLFLTDFDFVPRYPEGPVYDLFVATLPFFGLLADGDLPGTNDDRCDDDGEGGARIANGALNVAAIAADTVCNTIVVILGEGTNLPACVAAGVLHEAQQADEIVLAQCGYQTALVDSAEIEAGYENTRRILENELEIVELKRIHLQVVGIPAEGCSQGFWKNHTEVWDSALGADIVPNFDPATLFDSVFGAGADTGAGLRNNVSLLDTLAANGDVSEARNAVTLLLNTDAQNAGFALPCSPSIIGDIGSLVLPIPIKRHFLLSADEAGVPTDVVLDHVNSGQLSPSGTSLTEITSMVVATPVATGLQQLEITIPPEEANFNIFQFEATHDHGTTTLDGNPIKHYGTILVHRNHGSNLGMGQ